MSRVHLRLDLYLAHLKGLRSKRDITWAIELSRIAWTKFSLENFLSLGIDAIVEVSEYFNSV